MLLLIEYAVQKFLFSGPGQAPVRVPVIDLMVRGRCGPDTIRRISQAFFWDVVNKGIVMKVGVEAVTPFVSFVTRKSYVEMHLPEGEKMYLMFKALAAQAF